jgi:hypothetical protein
MLLVRIAFLSLLFPAITLAQVQSSSYSERKSAVDAPPPTAALELATRVLGPESKVIRYGHLSAPDLDEVIVGIPASGSDGATLISRLAILRQQGSNWSSDLTVDKVIRNSQGFLGATSLDQVHPSSFYKLSFFTRGFEDGKTRFVIELAPYTADGKSAGPSVYISWNPLVGRYQQISLEGYGFEPELHEPLHSRTP